MIAVLVLGVLVASAMFLFPALQPLWESDTEVPVAPEFGSTVRVDNPQFVLPARANDPARVYFNVTNVGQQDIHLTQVRIGAAAEADIEDTQGPAWKPVANLPLQPGETLSLTPGGTFAVISEYDSTVVPGATVNITLVFDTSASITVPATVTKAG
jgi:copper(I)-binding protein